VFDRNLICDKLNSLHDQAQNLLFGFKVPAALFVMRMSMLLIMSPRRGR
jgi:hypothetical protein